MKDHVKRVRTQYKDGSGRVCYVLGVNPSPNPPLLKFITSKLNSSRDRSLLYKKKKKKIVFKSWTCYIQIAGSH